MLLQKIQKKIDRHQMISFDIFDTLLVMPYARHTDLFLHIEKETGCADFQKNRILAEEKARQKKSELRDITLDKIYQGINPKFKHLKSVELEFLERVLQPNPEMKEVFDYARQKGKEIIITGATHLPSDFLIPLLSNKGLQGIQKLYDSTDTPRATKIFHIGSDRELNNRLEREKIHTYPYTSPFNQLCRQNSRAKVFFEKHTQELESSILLGILALENLSPKGDYWCSFGFRYGGPVVYAYIQWLNRQLLKDNIAEILFVARDGYTLEKVFNLIKTTDIKTHYFYAPRILNLVFNLGKKHDCEASEFDSTRAILEYLKEKDHYLQKATPDITTYQEGADFIHQNLKLYQDLLQKEIEAYQSYFKQFGIKEKNVALVDTTSQYLSAQRTAITGLPNHHIHGYYWMTWDNPNRTIPDKDVKTFQASHQQLFQDWNIMEFYMTAPTPSVSRIENGKPVFKNISPEEKNRIIVYPALSQGIIEFAETCQRIFGKADLNFSAEMMADWTNILCTIPTRQDQKNFVSLRHAWDMDHTQWIHFPGPWFKNYQDGVMSKFYFLNIPVFSYQKNEHKSVFYFLNIIPLFKWKNKEKKSSCALLGIPLYQIIRDRNKTKILLFQLIPILSVKKKELKV